jgi:hypothetical protein
MAAKTVQQVLVTGLKPVYSAPTITTGDTFTNNGRTQLFINNGSASPITLTIVSQAPAGSGIEDDLIATIPAGEEHIFGPLPVNRFSGNTTFICSAVADVTCAVVKVS